MVMDRDQVAFLMWEWCSWRWKVLVHPHERMELIGAQTIRKYDLQNY
jgi:hypothetical protein